jgi:hypothetical protein
MNLVCNAACSSTSYFGGFDFFGLHGVLASARSAVLFGIQQMKISSSIVMPV